MYCLQGSRCHHHCSPLDDGTTATVVAGPDGKWTVPNPGDR
nr:hypothetical protein [Acinetobacter nosocomialis]